MLISIFLTTLTRCLDGDSALSEAAESGGSEAAGSKVGAAADRRNEKVGPWRMRSSTGCTSTFPSVTRSWRLKKVCCLSSLLLATSADSPTPNIEPWFELDALRAVLKAPRDLPSMTTCAIPGELSSFSDSLAIAAAAFQSDGDRAVGVEPASRTWAGGIDG